MLAIAIIEANLSEQQLSFCYVIKYPLLSSNTYKFSNTHDTTKHEFDLGFYDCCHSRQILF